jgi:hypothetical protein
MPRPRKATVDYFPHFVTSGKTMFTLESKFGNDGYAFWFKLLEILGMSEQHYIDCENPVEWEFLLAKTRLNGETANNILETLAKLDAIDRDLWQDRIIRSRNFIANLSALYNRRTINVISNPEVRDLCMQKRRLNGVSVNKNPDVVCRNPQRRGEERRVENKKERDVDINEQNTSEQSPLEESEERLTPPQLQPKKRFIKPTLEEVKAYCKERKNNIDPQRFLDYYEANGWKIGKNPMKNWQAAVRTWERNQDSTAPPKSNGLRQSRMTGILDMEEANALR